MAVGAPELVKVQICVDGKLKEVSVHLPRQFSAQNSIVDCTSCCAEPRQVGL